MSYGASLLDREREVAGGNVVHEVKKSSLRDAFGQAQLMSSLSYDCLLYNACYSKSHMCVPSRLCSSEEFVATYNAYQIDCSWKCMDWVQNSYRSGLSCLTDALGAGPL